VANQLQETIKQVISDELRDYPILVWYDEEGSLQEAIFEAIPVGVNFVPYLGSYLAIRARIEKEDSEFNAKWLIYVPQEAIEPSWIRDYELFGKKVAINLEKLLVDYFGLESDLELKNLLAAERGRLLAGKWEEVMGEPKIPLQKSQIVKGLLSIAFNLGVSFSLGRAIQEYVTFPTPRQELLRLGLHDAFAKLIKSELGLDIEVEPENFPEALASALLFSELVFNSESLGEQKFSNLLPKKDKVETWARLAREWFENSSLRQGFIKWSTEIAKKYDLKSELQGVEKLLKVMSFSIVDEILLEELKTRVSSEPEAYKKNLEIIEKIAKSREKSPWAIIGKINIWHILGLSTQLYGLCEKTISLLEKNSPDIEFLANNYVKTEGWWKIDSIYRTLYTHVEQVDEDIWKNFLKPSFSIYTVWLRTFTECFSNAAEKLKEWKISGVTNQSNFWSKILEKRDKPLAVLLVDALRYDLGKELEGDLRQKGYEVEVTPMISSLPSITEIGMASLMPIRSMTVRVEKGKLEIFADEFTQINQKATRQKLLQEKLGSNAVFLELSEISKLSPISLKSKIDECEYIIVMDRDIDIAGTYLLEVSPDLFQELVMKLSNAIDKLHKTGLRTVIVSTDHGFLLIPKDYEMNTIEGIKSEDDVDKKRRYAIGRPRYNPSLIQFRLDQVWLNGDGIVVFPRGLSCLSMPAPIPMFLHGGISPQENCIPVVISKSKIEAGKVKIETEIPDEISTAVFLINLIPSIARGADKARVVRVEVYSDGRKIAESDAIELQRETKKARLILKEIKPEAEVKIIDVDTFEVLKSKKVKISIVGYPEEI
jgi:hypothetical protein